MKKSLKYMALFSALVMVVMWVVPKMVPVDNLSTLEVEFRSLAVKMTIGRLIVVGGVGLLFWPVICRLAGRYLSIDISRLQVRIMGWYLLAEAAILASFWGA